MTVHHREIPNRSDGKTVDPRFLYSPAEQFQRQRLTNQGRRARAIGSLFERGRATIANVSANTGIAHDHQMLQDTLVLHDRERFEVADIERSTRTVNSFKNEFDLTLSAVVLENSNEAALKSLYREVLHLYTKEIAYFAHKGESGVIACQALFSELVQFGLRGEIAKALALKQKGDENGGPGAKDTRLFDEGVIDELFLSVVAVTEVNFSIVTDWISTNRGSKNEDDLHFIDIALRYRTPLKGLVIGDAYYEGDQYNKDRVGDLWGFMQAVEALPDSDWKDTKKGEENIKRTMQTQLLALFLLNPQLFLKFTDLFKAHPHVLGNGELEKQRAKQDIRDKDFDALKSVGHRVSLLKGVKIPATLLDFIKSITEQDLFTFGGITEEKEGAKVLVAGRKTKLLGMMQAMREITKAMDRRRADESEDDHKARVDKGTRNNAFPMTRITNENKESIPAMKMFGEQIILPLIDKAIGSVETESGIAHAALLTQLMIGVTYFSPDSFIAEEALQPLRKQYGEKLLQSYHLIFNNPDALKDHKETLNVFKVIFQYMYRHWPVDDVKGVMDTYKAVTIGNSNASALTGGRLSTFLLNISFPDEDQLIDCEETRLTELPEYASKLLNDIAKKSEVFFGGTADKLDYDTLMGVGDIKANLRDRLDGLEFKRQVQGAPVVKLMENAITGVIADTLDIWRQLTEVAKYIPTTQKDLARSILNPMFKVVNEPYKEMMEENVSLPITQREKAIGGRVAEANAAVNRAQVPYNAAVVLQTKYGTAIAEAEGEMAKRIQEAITLRQSETAKFQEGLQAQIQAVVASVTAMAGLTAQPTMSISSITALPTIDIAKIMEFITAQANTDATTKKQLVDLEAQLKPEIVAIAGIQKQFNQMAHVVEELEVEFEEAKGIHMRLTVTEPNRLAQLKTARVLFQESLREEQARLMRTLNQQLKDKGFGLLLDWTTA